MSKDQILLAYDQECPVCDNYCKLVRIRKTVGDLKIINAREASDILDEITTDGLDIDQGMVLKMGGAALLWRRCNPRFGIDQ